MTHPPAPGSSSRSTAVGDLFAALEGLLISYQALPDGERETRWHAEAELITGAVALHLSTARSRIAARSGPWAPPRVLPVGPAEPHVPDAPVDTDAEPTDDRRPA